MKPYNEFWKPRQLPYNKACLWRLGPLRFWIVREASDWTTAVEHSEADVRDCSNVPLDVVPGGLSWSRWTFHQTSDTFAFKPKPPDRPVIMRTSESMVIPAGNDAMLFARIPVWAALHVFFGDESRELQTFPAVKLSDTWFGTYSQGELCYGLRHAAQRDYQKLEPGPQHIICPMKIVNTSGENLPFYKLCLRPERLAIYIGEEHLWSSTVTISYHGRKACSTLEYDPSPPKYEADLTELLPASNPTRSPISEPSFDFAHAPELY